MNLWCRLLQGPILPASLKPQQSPCIVDQHVPEPSFPREKQPLGWVPCKQHRQPGVWYSACTDKALVYSLVCRGVGGTVMLRDLEGLGAIVPQSDIGVHTHTHTHSFPQAAQYPSALTHPPCHQALTDGSYSHYLTFIKRPQCARSFTEQGCGWSQRVCPQKAAATWKR